MADSNVPITADGDVLIDCDNNNDSTTNVIKFTHDNGTELMRIQEDGKVGIGTTSPGAKLHILQPSGTAEVHSTVKGLIIQDGGYNDGNPFEIQNSGGVATVIVEDGGDVGVGTTNPSELLHLRKDHAGVTALIIENTNASGGERIYFQESATKVFYMFRGNSDDKFYMKSYNGATYRDIMILEEDGNIGIGTTSPVSLLTLNKATADTAITFQESATSQFTMGTDYSASNDFKISSGAALGTNDLIILNTSTLESNVDMIVKAATPAYIRIQSTGTDNAAMSYLDIGQTSADSFSLTGYIGDKLSDARRLQVFAYLNYDLSLGANNAEVVRIDTNRNVGINTTSFGGGLGVVGIGNRTTAPPSAPTGGCVLFVENGALKYRGSGNTLTTIAAA
ncbi:hypothetical protein KKF70_07465 [bacterium]|nr:hypothetical protein [bacterium]MBU3930477.1 hypothetical protein [bacterium]MBU4122621.1 hypothetical protein [bacterium]